MQPRYKRFGAFMAPFHPPTENPLLALERDLELLTWLDELAFDEVWVGEHHSAGWEYIASPELFLAVAAERTRHIKLGTGVVSLPYHHPMLVAERMAFLDNMTRGRVLFGVGPGALVTDALMLGVEPTRTRPMMEEALRMWRDIGDLPEVALALEGIGWIQFIGGEDDEEEGTRVPVDAPVSILASALVPDLAPRRSAPDRLTPRQREVLTLVGRGLAAKEIARQLGISVKTVEQHKSKIFGALGVPNQAAAAFVSAAAGAGRSDEWNPSTT